MGEVSDSDTPLKATFRIKLDGEFIATETIGQAYRFINSVSSVEWMEFRSLHNDAKAALEAAAENAMMRCRRQTHYARYFCARSFSEEGNTLPFRQSLIARSSRGCSNETSNKRSSQKCQQWPRQPAQVAFDLAR